MRRNAKELIGYSIHATDGEIGKVDDFYFDDERWTIRYMVVNTGHWLPGRKVLISPVSLLQPNWETKTFPVNLTKAQVRKSPDIDTAKPVSRQHEAELHRYYAWPAYWGIAPYPAQGYGMAAPPALGLAVTAVPEEAPAGSRKEDPHLRSMNEVRNYYIQANDGEIGHVEDFVVEDSTWEIRYLVVDTRNWLPGRNVLLSPEWIERVSWADSKVFVDVSREFVKNSPEFDPTKPINIDYEGKLRDYYGRPKSVK